MTLARRHAKGLAKDDRGSPAMCRGKNEDSAEAAVAATPSSQLSRPAHADEPLALSFAPDSSFFMSVLDRIGQFVSYGASRPQQLSRVAARHTASPGADF
jgi:hypothetical protein